MSHPFQSQPSALPPAQLGQSVAPALELPSFSALLKPNPIDRAAIFTKVTRRNAARRQAQLPLLDVQAEFEYGVSLAEKRAYRDFAATHTTKRQRIADEIVSEYVAKHGSRLGTSFTWWWISAEANRRFYAYLEQRYGVVPPSSASRNPIVYGSTHPQSDVNSSPLDDALTPPDTSPRGNA